jgi:hypothetical protein
VRLQYRPVQKKRIGKIYLKATFLHEFRPHGLPSRIYILLINRRLLRPTMSEYKKRSSMRVLGDINALMARSEHIRVDSTAGAKAITKVEMEELVQRIKALEYVYLVIPDSFQQPGG